MNEKLRTALLNLKEKRIAAKEADNAKKNYFNSPKGMTLAKEKKDADAQSTIAKKEVVDIGVQMVKAKDELDYGVKKKGVAEKETLVYTDEEATRYCLQNAHDALTVNRNVFDAILEAKGTLPDFVKKEITPAGFSITIPSDLSSLE